MLMKIMKFVVPCVMLLLIIGISLQYYVTMKLEPDALVCHKGKLLSQVNVEGKVYTKVKDFSCDYEKGMLIIEEQS
jgi:hypothetical protein